VERDLPAFVVLATTQVGGADGYGTVFKVKK
jgi:hypothetical protein